jgi:hypothetical protein
MTKDDVLSALGLATRPTVGTRWLGALGFLGAGMLVGAATALLLAPKSGRELRGKIGAHLAAVRRPPVDGTASPVLSA